ncbi:MAG: universal stress protein [Caulobacter sp.]|nr:universal stress protein [Caulobacter sp.]
MTYRDILVQMDEAPAAEVRAALAAEMARKFRGAVDGVFLESRFMNDVMAAQVQAYLAPAEIDALIQDHAKGVAAASETARATFEAAATAAGAASTWRNIPGEDHHSLIACARRCDLMVAPPRIQVSCSRTAISAGDLGMDIGGPLLIVPDSAAPTCGNRVIVAWNGSREAARALRDSWPLLALAAEVHILVVSPHGEGGPDGLLQRLFERHGRKANLLLDRSKDGSVAEILRHQVKALGADLVVMGLYGRPRLQELVLGGLSRDLLSEPPTTLLVSH